MVGLPGRKPLTVEDVLPEECINAVCEVFARNSGKPFCFADGVNQVAEAIEPYLTEIRERSGNEDAHLMDVAATILIAGLEAGGWKPHG